MKRVEFPACTCLGPDRHNWWRCQQTTSNFNYEIKSNFTATSIGNESGTKEVLNSLKKIVPNLVQFCGKFWISLGQNVPVTDCSSSEAFVATRVTKNISDDK